MSLVPGEDTESDEEIDTDQVHDASGRADKGKKVVPRAGLVTGEDSEEEDGKQWWHTYSLSELRHLDSDLCLYRLTQNYSYSHHANACSLAALDFLLISLVGVQDLTF